MDPQRFIALLLAACLVSILALGWYLRRSAPSGSEDQTASTSEASLATSSPTPTASAQPTAPLGHRLAGTVVGDEQYVIIEDPDGANELYRPGESVPGLGKLVEIGPDRAAFDSDAGRILLRLLPGSTPTSSPRATPTSALADTSEPTPAPPPPDRSAPAPSPSAEPDRSAS
jgi:hypothetical protein